MKTIYLDLQEAGIENLSENEDKFSTPTKSKLTSKTVSEEITGIWEAPKNINSFLTKIYPNLRSFLLARGISKDESDEVISDFIISFLSKDSKGVTRYLKYDAKYKVAYHKWVITTLGFFLRSYFKKSQKIRDRETQLGDPETCQEGEFNQTHQAYLDYSEIKSTNPVDLVESTEFLNMAIAETQENVFSEFAKNSVPKVVAMLKSGFTKVEISKELGVSTCSIQKWSNLFNKSCMKLAS